MFPIRATATSFTLYSLLVLGAVSAAIGAFMAIVLGGGGFPVVMLDGFHWLQGLYLAVGIIEIVLVLALLGVRPAVADAEPASTQKIAS